LNYHDVFTRRGMPGIRVPLPVIVGLDVAGEIVAVGHGVSGWAAGDRVLVDPINRVEGGLMGETVNGGLAEYCRARAHQLIRIPAGITFAQAAALPVAYGTALRMMTTIGAVERGEKVLILGASGGVGVCCVQLARLAGADVIILYTQEDFLKVVQERHGKPHRRRHAPGGGVDVVVNYTGGDTWVKSLRCLRLGGRLLTCGATAGFDPKEDIRFIWTFELKVLGSNGWERGDIESLFELVESGKLKVLIERTYPLAEAVEAVRAIEERRVFGKVVVTP